MYINNNNLYKNLSILFCYRYLVEAGKDYTYEIKLKNIGNKDIAISPKLVEGGNIIYGYAASSSAVSSSAASSSPVSSNEFSVLQVQLLQV